MNIYSKQYYYNNNLNYNKNYLLLVDENRQRQLEYSKYLRDNNLFNSNRRPKSNTIYRSGNPSRTGKNSYIYYNNNQKKDNKDKKYQTSKLKDYNYSYNPYSNQFNYYEINKDTFTYNPHLPQDNYDDLLDKKYNLNYNNLEKERKKQREKDNKYYNRLIYGSKINFNVKNEINKNKNNLFDDNKYNNNQYYGLLQNTNTQILSRENHNLNTYYKERERDKECKIDANKTQILNSMYGNGNEYNTKKVNKNEEKYDFDYNNKLYNNKEEKKQNINSKYNEANNFNKINKEENNNNKNNYGINKSNIINNNNKLKTSINQNEPEINLATSKDYYEEEMKTQATTHHRSNESTYPKSKHSKSVNPYKNISVTEISQITNSLIGLNNLGSTCYMNSALQNIIHCKKLIEKLVSYKNNIKNNSKDNINITLSFLNLCYSLVNQKPTYERRYLSSYVSSLYSFSPSSFKSDFSKKHKAFTRGQHDSIEFLRTLLDDISKEININQNISAYKELTTTGKSKKEQNLEYHNFFIGRENSIIIDTFYIQMINIFTCKCGFESYSFQKLLDIPLLLPTKGKREIDLISLIRDYLQEEKIDWSSKCEKCEKANLIHYKKIKISMLNEIIIFSLQRFDPFLSMKNSINVSYQENIDLREFCDTDLYKANTKYKLFGTINHIGNIDYGHYYSNIKIGEIWYEFNDSIIRTINRMDYNNSYACVLFYEKIYD